MTSPNRCQHQTHAQPWGERHRPGCQAVAMQTGWTTLGVGFSDVQSCGGCLHEATLLRALRAVQGHAFLFLLLAGTREVSRVRGYPMPTLSLNAALRTTVVSTSATGSGLGCACDRVL